MKPFRRQTTRREFLRQAVTGTCALGSMAIPWGKARAEPRACHVAFAFPTPIFRVDDVRTYIDQTGPAPIMRTGASAIAPDPNPDDPSIAPGMHYYHKGVERILEKMAMAGYPLWKSSGSYAPPSLPLQFPPEGTDQDGGFGLGSGHYGGSGGLFRHDDIIVIKINAMAAAHCMVNLDILKGLIQRIVDHPDGFSGEIIVLDKYFDDEPPNAYHSRNTVSAVCNSFPDHRVSRVLLKDRVWHDRKVEQVRNGFVELEDLYPGIPAIERVSYPKFTTRFGSHIDLKLGWWNGTAYENDRLRLIGYSVLKDQAWTAVTCCLKNFVGITNIGTVKFGGSENDPAKGWHRTHEGIYKNGLLGRILRFVRFPDLFLVDATRILAQAPLGPGAPDGPFAQPGVLLAGFDPVNIDYYAAKEVLLPQSIQTPCAGIKNPGWPPVCHSHPGVTHYPCSATGQCARHDPDFHSHARVHPWYKGRPGFAMREAPPLDAFRRTLTQASIALYGGLFMGPGYFTVT
jgi:uncharacterized protein (DUF362 family)